ncbi:MAG: hypothetical protein EOP11_12605, partial [Proteobacteria bacterium]
MISWLLFLSVSLTAHATERATVILLRGTASTGAGQALNLKDLVEPGTTITTGPKSFVKLLFPDQTQMNIGPASTLRLEATRPGEVSLVSLVAGQIRAKVAKDPFSSRGPSKEKLVVKTRSAAMGIRGTDFNVSYNPANRLTALITFEGHVAMANLGPNEHALRVLENDRRLQHVGPGQFSGTLADAATPSVPVRISPVQLEALRENDSFRGLGERGAAAPVAFASPIPPGVDPRAFTGGEKSGELPAPLVNLGSAPPPPAEGFFDEKSKTYAPRAGGYVDLGSGRYVPPPAGSAFDPNTSTFVPPKAMGEVDPGTGMYVPPKGVQLDPVKGFVPEPAAPIPSANGTRAPSSIAPASVNAAAALNQAASREQAG